jgi:large subunit ribosomal protein L23
MKVNQIIKQPVLTEKAMNSQESNCYLFWVDIKATKGQIKEAVKDLFGVEPLSIRTNRYRNKKRAYVQLEEGKEIAIAKLGE